MIFTKTQNGIIVGSPEGVGTILGMIQQNEDNGFYEFHPSGEVIRPEWMCAIGDVIIKEMNLGYIYGSVQQLSRELH